MDKAELFPNRVFFLISVFLFFCFCLQNQKLNDDEEDDATANDDEVDLDSFFLILHV